VVAVVVQVQMLVQVAQAAEALVVLKPLVALEQSILVVAVVVRKRTALLI
jgi:hypothetical protein